MSLSPDTIGAVPEETARIARSAFPKSNLCLRLRDEVGTVYNDQMFSQLFSKRGQPAEAPWRLALVLVLQFAEGLTDRQVADAGPIGLFSRIDWKYLLGLELSDPGFDASVLCEFRARIVEGSLEELSLDTLLATCKARGWLKARGTQRTDITYIKLQTEFVYLAVVMNLFTRTVRGWQLSRWLDQSLTLEALQCALQHHEPPQIHHSDQGVQYAARAYVAQLQAFQIKVSMADVGAAWQNGYAERIIRTIKEEEIDLADYQDFADAYAQIGHFVEQVYQHKRIHSALGYLTPAEFEADWRQQHQPPSLPIV